MHIAYSIQYASGMVMRLRATPACRAAAHLCTTAGGGSELQRASAGAPALLLENVSSVPK